VVRGRLPHVHRTLVIAVAALLLALVVVVAVVVVAGTNDPPARIGVERTNHAAGATPPATTPATSPPTTSAPPTPPTTSAPPATTVPPRTGEIATLPIADPHPEGYVRDEFGAGWIDADHDCQDTRAEVLVLESRTAVTFTTPADCTVAAGEWIDPWSGTVTTSARALDVDHTVPLANAWRSGAWAWTPAQRLAYANDVADAGHLIAIPLGENRSKGDDGPEGWRPPARSSWCAYAQTWTSIKAKWGLSATPAEWAALQEMAATC
jgi:hypothetical protein